MTEGKSLQIKDLTVILIPVIFTTIVTAVAAYFSSQLAIEKRLSANETKINAFSGQLASLEGQIKELRIIRDKIDDLVSTYEKVLEKNIQSYKNELSDLSLQYSTRHEELNKRIDSIESIAITQNDFIGLKASSQWLSFKDNNILLKFPIFFNPARTGSAVDA